MAPEKRDSRVRNTFSTAVPVPHELQNSMILAQSLEMHAEVPMYLRDSIKVMPGAYYGADYLDQFEKEFYTTVGTEPKSVHIVAADGLPGSGKTTLLDEMLKNLLFGNTILSQFAREEGYTFRIINVPWGDVFHQIPDAMRVTGVQYHEDKSAYAAKRREVELANRIFEEPFIDVLSRSKTDGEITIISTDIPAMTGLITAGNETIGMPRGYKLMRDLGKGKGPFEKFEGQYSLHCIGLAATREVRDVARGRREVMLQYKNPEAMQNEMMRYGLEFQVNDTAQIIEYMAECAPPGEMDLLDMDAYFFLKEIVERFGSSFDDLQMIRPAILESPESFLTNDYETVASIGQGLLPWMHRIHYGIDSKQAIILLNDQVLPKQLLHLDVQSERPLAVEI